MESMGSSGDEKLVKTPLKIVVVRFPPAEE
jgi:hypothetical protein